MVWEAENAKRLAIVYMVPCFDRVGCDRAGLSRQFIRSRFVGADYGAEGSSASSGITAAGRTRRPSAERCNGDRGLLRGSPDPRRPRMSSGSAIEKYGASRAI